MVWLDKMFVCLLAFVYGHLSTGVCIIVCLNRSYEEVLGATCMAAAGQMTGLEVQCSSRGLFVVDDGSSLVLAES